MIQAAGVIAIVALIVTVASLAYLHLKPTGLSAVRNPVSQYGIGPFAHGYRVATIAFGVAAVALAVGVERAVSAPGRATVVVLLAVFAVARLAISWFPMDLPGGEQTATGRRHLLLAAAAFTSIGAAAFELAGALAGASRWHDLAPVSRALAWMMLACLIGLVLARRQPVLRALFGAIERGFYAAAITWCTVFAVACAVLGA